MTIKLSIEEFEAAQEDYSGFCLVCGAECGGCEPDAREYECEECGAFAVYGAEELLMMGKLQLVDDDE